MEVRIRHGKDNQSEAFARFHRVVCDKPFDEGGSDNGMTPLELMLSALGCCAMHQAVEYLRAGNLAQGEIELSVSAKEGLSPARLAEIGIEVNAPRLGMRARKGIIKAIEECLLRRALTDPPRLKVHLAAIAPEGPSAKRPLGLAP